MDLFFIDWEKPRRVLDKGGEAEDAAPVSCWRTLFIANEWNELQTIRKTAPEVTFLVVVSAKEGVTGVAGLTQSLRHFCAQF